LPLVTLDIWRRFARSPKGMAALALRYGTLPKGFLDRFDQELPFAWEAVPFEAWKQAIECLQGQCTNRFGDAGTTDILQTHLDSRIKDMTAAHGTLNFLLGIVSAKHIQGAGQHLEGLRAVGETHFSSLFNGEDCRLMKLRRHHADDDWPICPDSILAQARKQAEVKHLLCFKDDLDNCKGVVNIPLLLATQVWTNQADQWFVDPGTIHILRAHRAFDPEWFDEAYNWTIARCLTDSFDDC
jgi:hypothetical protein